MALWALCWSLGVALGWPWGSLGVALGWLWTPESMPSICLVYGFVVALGGFARAGLDGLFPPRAFGGSVFCHLPSAICLPLPGCSIENSGIPGEIPCVHSQTRRMVDLPVRRFGSASSVFCPRRRCVVGGSPKEPRCSPHVGRITCCGCQTYGQICVFWARP